MRKSIYFLTTTPSSHTHRLRKVKSMDDNCGEWVECMGVASGCGEQEAGVASGSGWNLATAGVLNWRYDAIHGARECQRASIFFLAPL